MFSVKFATKLLNLNFKCFKLVNLWQSPWPTFQGVAKNLVILKIFIGCNFPRVPVVKNSMLKISEILLR